MARTIETISTHVAGGQPGAPSVSPSSTLSSSVSSCVTNSVGHQCLLTVTEVADAEVTSKRAELVRWVQRAELESEIWRAEREICAWRAGLEN
jgi:hypothetical protein